MPFSATDLTLMRMTMLPKLPRFWIMLIGLVFILSAFSTAVLGGHPYQDRHFNLDSTPRYGSGMVTSTADGSVADYTTGTLSGTCASGTCGRSLGGSGSGNCPPVTNAILKLWVPDGATVEINGHRTRPQMLGGIHQGSRVYSLEGLDADRVSPCDIVVECDHQRYQYGLAVQAGGHYQARFPDGFEPQWMTLEDTPITEESSF